MAKRTSATDPTTLQMALVGYQIQKEKLDERIREIQAELKQKPDAAAKTKRRGGKRNLSAAARKRIAAAQKKRWAEHRKRQAESK